jgi:lipid II isoglutaminyl synthase (glutamine-hydrolysing)
MSRSASALPLRTRTAVVAGRLASRASRLLGRGHGAVIGGRVTLAVDGQALTRLVGTRPVTVVTGTNGKSTTTRLVAEALSADRLAVANRGANMPPGLIESAARRDAAELVFEVDELYVPDVVRRTRASTLVLLNITRDQLDRMSEIRRIAELWRALLIEVSWPITVVANADDPLVVWAVGNHADVVWVAAGYRWREDAALCPQCARVRTMAHDGNFTCECGLNRPVATWRIAGDDLIDPHGIAHPVQLTLPGEFNKTNAAMAIAVAATKHVDVGRALARLATVADVSGRYVTRVVRGRTVRLFLAKNPASWTESLHLVHSEPGRAAILLINARSADGMDTSWLWDVPFEELRGRAIAVSGDRRIDMGLRLHVGDVAHTIAPTLREAIDAVPAGDVEVLATYTAFHDALKELQVDW